MRPEAPEAGPVRHPPTRTRVASGNGVICPPCPAAAIRAVRSDIDPDVVLATRRPLAGCAVPSGPGSGCRRTTNAPRAPAAPRQRRAARPTPSGTPRKRSPPRFRARCLRARSSAARMISACWSSWCTNPSRPELLECPGRSLDVGGRNRKRHLPPGRSRKSPSTVRFTRYRAPTRSRRGNAS